jgi:nitronate monooxygenase
MMGPATDTPTVHGKLHMAELSTPWSRAMGLGAPILNAPMGGVAGGRLASAVSEAGGLGMIGVGSAGSVELLEREVTHPQVAGLPFGIGLLDWALAREPQLLDAAIAASPVLISVSFGDTWRWAERVREAGIVTAAQVSCVESARAAADAGIDVLVARGAEGGGHGEPAVGTLPLLEGILETTSIPVLAAGGISTSRGLAAVLAAGASGAWLGTAFAACSESLASDATRSALIGAKDTDTVMTRVFDIALEYPWPIKYPERILRNEFWERWQGQEEQLSADPEALSEFKASRARGNLGTTHVDAGQGVGRITQVRTASDVVSRLCAGAVELLGSWASNANWAKRS